MLIVKCVAEHNNKSEFLNSKSEIYASGTISNVQNYKLSKTMFGSTTTKVNMDSRFRGNDKMVNIMILCDIRGKSKLKKQSQFAGHRSECIGRRVEEHMSKKSKTKPM
jgi:hypothetical protein